jgi:hypothetical protein
MPLRAAVSQKSVASRDTNKGLSKSPCQTMAVWRFPAALITRHDCGKSKAAKNY